MGREKKSPETNSLSTRGRSKVLRNVNSDCWRSPSAIPNTALKYALALWGKYEGLLRRELGMSDLTICRPILLGN